MAVQYRMTWAVYSALLDLQKSRTDQLDEFQLEVLGYLTAMATFHSKTKKRVPQELLVSYVMTFASSSEHFQPKLKRQVKK